MPRMSSLTLARVEAAIRSSWSVETCDPAGVDELVQPPTVVARPAGPPRRCAEQYLLLRRHVFEALGRDLPGGGGD